MSLRLRLTLFYAALLGAVLVAFAAVLFVLLQDSLLRAADRVLYDSARQVELSIEANITAVGLLAGTPAIQFDSSPIREFTTPGIYVQILDQQGRIVARSTNLGSEIMPINPDLVQAAINGESDIRNTTPGRLAEPLRILTKPLVIRGSIFGVLQVGESLYSLRLTMRWLVLLLSLGVLSAMAVAALAIWLLTQRALRPIEAIASTAERIGSAQDLSQRLQIATPNDEVGRLAQAFNTMMARLERAFVSQKQFIADSSHELRTPLTVIRGNLDLLKRDTRPESQAECLGAIEQEAVRMGKIVEDLMLLAQLDSTHPRQLQPVALEEVVIQVAQQACVLAPDKNIVMGHLDAAKVMADRDRLVQMLLNLVDNAIKYPPAGGTITVECHAGDGHAGGRRQRYATLSVRDTGIGIPAEHLPHIFDRFYRVDRARSRAMGGTGLGLAIVKSIAEAYGGTVSVQSTVGQGSTFTVKLPLSP